MLAITRAGIPVWSQFGVTPHTALHYGGMSKAGPELALALKDTLMSDAKRLEDAGAALLDFTNSGPVAGAEIARAIGIPVIGGLGGGPWLDGRVRSVFSAVGYLAAALDDETERYANVAKITFDAITNFAADVRASRQIRGAPPAAQARTTP